MAETCVPHVSKGQTQNARVWSKDRFIDQEGVN